eukprot:scaffold325916_cov20-Prasinocladus_malaysianus.AAC.1
MALFEQMQRLEEVRRVASNIESTLALQAQEVEAERQRRDKVRKRPVARPFALSFDVFPAAHMNPGRRNDCICSESKKVVADFSR